MWLQAEIGQLHLNGHAKVRKNTAHCVHEKKKPVKNVILTGFPPPSVDTFLSLESTALSILGL